MKAITNENISLKINNVINECQLARIDKKTPIAKYNLAWDIINLASKVNQCHMDTILGEVNAYKMRKGTHKHAIGVYPTAHVDPSLQVAMDANIDELNKKIEEWNNL